MSDYPKEYAEKLAAEYGHTLDAEGNVTSPGKFEGETWRTIDAYDTLQNGMENESFGDAQEGGFWFSADIETGETIYCNISEQGFVGEYSRKAYEDAQVAEQEENERAEAIEELEREIAEAQEQEKGTCDSCEVLMINGVRCHETGCPRESRLKEMQNRLERLQDF
jgi:hypothetical protein